MAKIVIEIPILKAFENSFKSEMLEGLTTFVKRKIKEIPVANVFEASKIVCRIVRE